MKSQNLFFHFAITKTCVAICLAEDATRMGGIEFQLSPSINIVETSYGQPPQALGNPKDQAYDIASVHAIISNYKNPPSINQSRKGSPNPKLYCFPGAKKKK